MVRTPGVAKASGLSLPGRFSTGAGAAVARSTLAAYPQPSQIATSSSPASDSTMNSIEALPPMAPDDASTGWASRSRRRKVRR